MALIKCPECGNSVSDKAKACIHCGCPIEGQPRISYEVTFKGFKSSFDKGAYLGPAAMDLHRIVGIDHSAAVNMMQNLPQAIDTKLTQEYANWLKEYFGGKYAIIIGVEELHEAPSEERTRFYDIKMGKLVVCPRCGSNHITTDTRGYSFVFGFLGSGQTVNRCASCGYSWKPSTL